MVYCGKPSKNCGLCRQRRIKCNQARPACSQCIRAGKPCPGYRDQASLMFRDESKAIVRKARIRESSEEQGVDSSASPSSPDTSTPQSLVNAAQIDAIDQKGTRFFFKQYIVHPGESNSTPPDTSLINVYAHAPLGVLLFDSAVAIGLAGLANINHDVNLMVCARRKYGNVIRGTSAALENVKPDTVQQLLYTAMLLTMFEMVTWSPGSRELNFLHMKGISALMKARGDHEASYQGLRLLWTVCLLIPVTCLQNDRDLPDTWIEMPELHTPLSEIEQPAYQLVNIVSRFVKLNSAFRQQKLKDPETILWAALSIESEFEIWETTLPEKWHFTVYIPPVGNEAYYEGTCHLYHHLWIGKIWNSYRTTRILVTEFILKLLSSLPPKSSIWETTSFNYDTQRQKCQDILTDKARDICHSSMYHLDRTLFRRSTPHSGPQVVGILNLIWSLRAAGCTEATTQDMMKFCVSLLLKIGRSTGNNLAMAMAKTVRESWMEKHGQRKQMALLLSQ